MLTLPPLTWLTLAATLEGGVLLALLGQLKLQLARRPDQADRQLLNLLSLLNLLLIPLFLAAGCLVDRFGARALFLTGSILLTLAFLSFSAGLAYWRTLAAILVAAAGGACIITTAVTLLPAGLFGRDETAASMQLGLVLVALAALVTPPLVERLVDGVGERSGMAVIALVLLAPAFLVALPTADELPVRASQEAVAAVIQEPGLWLGAVVVFFYAPLEAFISIWTASYLGQVGRPEKESRWVGRFWAAVLVSRLAMALLQHTSGLGDAYDASFLVLLALLAAVTLGNLSGVRRIERARPGVVLVGVFLGPVFPLLLGMVFGLSGVQEVPGTAYGLLFAAGSLGSVVLTPLVRYSAQERTIQSALRVPLLVAMALTAAALVFALLSEGDRDGGSRPRLGDAAVLRQRLAGGRVDAQQRLAAEMEAGRGRHCRDLVAAFVEQRRSQRHEVEADVGGPVGRRDVASVAHRPARVGQPVDRQPVARLDRGVGGIEYLADGYLTIQIVNLGDDVDL